MASTPAQTILDTGADSSLSTLYPATLQSIPSVAGNTTIYITNKEEFITNIITENGAGGLDNEIQFNIGGRSSGDSGLTYDAATDSLSVANTIQVGAVRTDSLLYANGAAWNLGTNYANSNVSAYLNSGTYTGNFTVNNFSATTYSGNAAGLRNITAANIVGSVANAVYAEAAGAASSINAANVIGTVANAAYATTAGTAGSAATASTVTQAAQANITSVGTLTSLSVTNTVSAALFSGSGANLTSIPVANLSGTVGFATTAGTVTTAAQPNITSVGTLSGLSVTSTITGNISGSSATAGTVTTAAQPNITSTGTLTSVTVGSSAPIYLYANGLANVTSTAASTNTTSGALKVAGGIGVVGNVHAGELHAVGNIEGQLGKFGINVSGTALVNPVLIGKSTGTDYIQAALINSTDTGSSDYTAYGDNGDTDTAWVDLGFTGSNFSDANYTITGSNDGYVFVQGSGGLGGNLVLATGNLGYSIHRDIVFATGGFLANNERMRLNHETLSLDISTQQAAISTTSGSFRVDGGAGITGNVYVGGKVDANTITLSGTGTAVDAGQGNILTNQVTGTYFNFLNGGFTAKLTASGGATANYTLTLPATAGSSGQVLTTDGSGVLSWSTKPVVWTTAPVSNVSTGTAGEAAYDSGGNLFVCVATNTWAKFTGALSW